MATFDKTILTANGIVRTKQNNQLRCSLCTTDANSNDWQAHINNPRHINALRQFNLVFVRNSENLYCKACDTSFDRDNFESHAKWHRIVPWYELANKYKSFFENHILQFDNNFLCLACKDSFTESAEVLVHISDEEHQNLNACEPPIHDSFAVTDACYKLLVTEGFEPWGAATVKCRICNCPNVPVKSIKEHIDRIDHTCGKMIFQKNFQNRKNTPAETGRRDKNSENIGTEQNNVRRYVPNRGNRGKVGTPNRGGSPYTGRSLERSIDRNNGDKNCQSFNRPYNPKRHFNDKNSGNNRQNSDNFPVELRTNGRYCTICECAVNSTVDEHIADERHLSRLGYYGHEYILPIANHKYHCKSCDCTVPNLENVYRHIKGIKHRELLKRVAKKVPESVTKSVTPTVTPTVTPNVQETRTNSGRGGTVSFKMNFPPVNTMNVPPPKTMNFPPPSAMIIPPRTAMHISPLMGMNCPPLTSMIIPPRAAMLIHPPTAMNIPPPTAINIPPPAATNFTKSLWESLPRDYIVLQNSKDLFCRICDCIIYGHDNVDAHIASLNHTTAIDKFCSSISLLANNVYYCKHCNCECRDRDSLYFHVTGQQHTAALSGMNKNELRSDNITPESENSSKLLEHIPVSEQIVKLGSEDFCCKICHLVLFDQKKIDQHTTEQRHLDSFKLYKNATSITDGKYYCETCSCTIPNFANVHVHTIGTRHKTSLPGANQIPLNFENKNVQIDWKAFARDYVAISRDNNFYCTICNMSFFSLSTVREHIEGKSHEAALMKYGCDNIMLREGKMYECKWCNCIIPTIDNVYVHISGKRHLQNITDKKETATLTNRDIRESEEISKQAEVRAAVSVSSESKKQNLSEIVNPPIGQISINSSVGRTNEMENSMIIGSKARETEEYGNVIETIVNETKKVENIITNRANTDLVSERSSKHSDNNYSVNDFSVNADPNSGISSGAHLDKSFKRSNETIASITSDFVKLPSMSMSTLSLNEIGNTGRKRRVPRITSARKNMEIFNVDSDHIHGMTEKLREIEKGMKLFFIRDSNDIYCLVCRKQIANNMHNYSEHLWTIQHCESLETMEKDHAPFEAAPGQFSELDLATEFMTETSEDMIYCHICDTDMDNIDYTLKDHINGVNHREKRDEKRSMAGKIFQDVKSRIQCDWYNIFKYQCAPCSVNFDSELTFAKHLNSVGHSTVMKEMISPRVMLYDFCSPCALLWYGYRDTYATHCDIPLHKWQIRDEDHVSPQLLTSTKILLAMPEEYVHDTVKYLNEMSVREGEKIDMLLCDIEATTRSITAKVKAYPFGTRVAGLDSLDADIKVFLDCGDMYDGSDSAVRSIMKASVTECLTENPQSWDTEDLLTKSQSSTIKVRHRETGLNCQLFFDNGLSVESTMLIRSINDKSPQCRKMIIFLKQWLEFCGLFGPEKITSHALCWYVVFYLQRESLLPDVAKLIGTKGKSHLIAGWEVGVSRDFNCDRTESRSTKELLIGFFAFYANFDYRYDVACPLLGATVRKGAFANPENFPEAMRPYMNYVQSSNNPEPFKNDSPMCIQHPFHLASNLTRDVSKVTLSRFRTYCFKSLDVLDRPPSQ